MKERPIIFSGEMVRAILEGRRTQTRRIINPQPYEGCSKLIGPEMYAPAIEDKDGMIDAGPEIYGVYDEYGEYGCKCPYGQPGDRLWVRETWAMSGHERVEYRAFPKDGKDFRSVSGWRASIHMPRWASRITLEIVDVKVERLQKMSSDDLEKEGLNYFENEDFCAAEHYQAGGSPIQGGSPERFAFIALWNRIYGAGSWESNPWVWKIEFKRI